MEKHKQKDQKDYDLKNHEDLDLLTVPEAAKLLRCSVATIRSWIYQEKIPHR